MYIVAYKMMSKREGQELCSWSMFDKFDSKKDADKKAKNLKKTSGEAHFFSFSKIEVLEVA